MNLPLARFLRAACLLPPLLAFAAPVAPTQPDQLTARDFFRPPTVVAARLSPDGTHLAALAYEESTDSTGLRIIDLARKSTGGLRGSKAYDVRTFTWVGNERLVFSITRDNLYAYGLYSILRDKPETPTAINYRDVVQVLGSPRERPDNVFVWVRRDSHNEGRPGALVELDMKRSYRVGFDADYSVVRNTVQQPKVDSVLGWLPDRNGEVRYAVGHRKGLAGLYRREADGTWTSLSLDLDTISPLAVDTDPNVLLAARLGPDGRRDLVRYNTADGTVGPALHHDDKYDFSNAAALFSTGDREFIGLRYARQAPTQVWLRPEEAELQELIDRSLPAGRINLLIDSSRDGRRVLVRSSSDRHPGAIFLFEPAAGLATQITNLAPWLPENLLGPVQLMTYTARDGLKLDAYLTLPAHYEAGHPAPLIVLPHGGPWARDAWGYDPESQFFASRGYVVFRPNYRGSTGYHADISLKDRLEFRKMNDDVTDGVRALIRGGIADPKRVAIVGSSFGGYLALCGAAFEPDLYRCAVTVAGVFDWERVLRDARLGDTDSYRYERLLRDLGDPKKNAERFEAMSPLSAVNQIKIPVFVAHGKEDQVADASQSTRLAKALAKAGIPCETMFVSDEGHGFSSLKHRVQLYERIESFLKKNL